MTTSPSPRRRRSGGRRFGHAPRRTTGWILALGLLAAGLTASSPATAGEEDDLDQAREELDVAERDLADVEARIRSTQAAVEAAERRIASAGTALAEIRGDLALAEAAMDAAVAEEQAASELLLAANARLDAHRSDWHERRDRIEALAAAAYRAGGVTRGQLLLAGVSRARDLHDLALIERTVRTLASVDHDLATEAQRLALAATSARAEVASVQSDAAVAARDAARERRTVASLVARQESLIRQIADDVRERRAALEALSTDRTAMAVLVRLLRERIGRLQTSLAEVLLERSNLPFDGPPPSWAPYVPPAGQPWAPAIEAAARRSGMDGRLFAALVWSESGFNPAAVSHAGAIGMAQLMPGTAAALGVDPWDPIANLVGGARYLRAQIDRFQAVDLGLAAYNAGPGRVERAGNRVPEIAETQLYVLRVLERFERLVTATAPE